MFSKLLNKIKFMFKSKEDTKYEFTKDEPVEVKKVVAVDLAKGPDVVVNRTFIYPGPKVYFFNKEKDRLEQILLRTKKFRIRKKIRRRIEKSF